MGRGGGCTGLCGVARSLALGACTQPWPVPSSLTNLCDLYDGGGGAVLPVMLMEQSLKRGARPP